MAKHLTLFLYAWLWLGWFAAVLLGKYGYEAASLLVPLVGWLLFVFSQHPRFRDCTRLLGIVSLGILADLAALKIGFITITAESESFFPLWLFALWLLLAPAFALLQKPLRQRLWLAAILGAVFGPLSYYSGGSFGVLEINGTGAFAAYAVFWFCYVPLGIYLARPNKFIS